MKILNSTVINGKIAKMIETQDNFIINGQVYDKSSLAPTAMSFCPIISSINNEISLYKTGYVYSSFLRNNTENGFMLDINDPNICYIITQGLIADGPCGITKITNNSTGTFSSVYTTFSGYNATIDLICQDSQKVYYMGNRDYDGSYSYIGYVNKATMVSTNININTATIKVLKVTDMYIYIASSTVNTDQMNIGKYNKLKNTITWLFADPLTGFYASNIVSDIDNDGVFYCRRDGITMGNTNHCMSFKKYTLDINKDIVISTNVICDNNIFPNGYIPISLSHMYITNLILKYTDSNTSKTYMTCIVYNNGTKGTFLPPKDSAMYTYEVIDPDNWKLVSYTQFNPILYRSCLPVVGNQTIMMAYENGVHIFTWDSGTTSYKKVSSFDVSVSAIACDNNNNLYIQYDDTSIEMISNVMPINVYVDFEKDSYPYDGSSDILSNVVLYVQNYQNKYLSTSVQLTLFGNCKFTSDGSRTKTVTTSDVDKKLIPVSITGEGNIKVSYKLL